MNVPDVSFSFNRSSSARILQAFECQLSFARDNVSMTSDNLAVEVLPSVSLANSLGFASKAEDGDLPVDDTLVNNDEELIVGSRHSIPDGVFDEAEASILIQQNQTEGMNNLYICYQIYILNDTKFNRYLGQKRVGPYASRSTLLGAYSISVASYPHVP